MERKTRFELATLALARRCSTAELLPRGSAFIKRAGLFPLPGNGVVCANRRAMHDAGLVVVALVVGGALYLAIFFWVTVQRVRELGPPKPPPEHH
jgi:hypothetical protein